MLKRVSTPFVLTLDADSMISERQLDGLRKLMEKMTKEGFGAACFRIDPSEGGWLASLQRIDYLSRGKFDAHGKHCRGRRENVFHSFH